MLSFDGELSAIKADPNENDEVRWIAKDELAEYFDPAHHDYITLEQYFNKGS